MPPITAAKGLARAPAPSILSDRAGRMAVSVKAVLVCAEHVLLLRQPNGYWELPGGRREPGETLEVCLRREILEETGLAAEPETILDSWLRVKDDGARRFVITYLVRLDGAPEPGRLTMSNEHEAACFVAPDAELPLPILDGYRRSVERARQLPQGLPCSAGRPVLRSATASGAFAAKFDYILR